MKINLFICAAALLCSSNAFAAGKDKNAVGLFLGATNAKSETEFTYGFEYEYKFADHWGAGIVLERTDEAHHGDGVEVAVGSLYFHSEAWRFGAGIGREKIKGAHPHTEDLYRLSGSYDIHLGDFAIVPTIAIDFIDDDEAVVYGIAILKTF